MATQKYYYDSLNRIDDAIETIGSTQTWRQDFTYDRWGNRNFLEANTTTIPKLCTSGGQPAVCEADRKVYDPAINPANNQLSAADDYAFDSVGNTTSDALGRTFKYDSENKQVEVKNASSVTIGQYFYDGDGKRVKKIVSGDSGETTIFVYDAAGKQIAEYSTNVLPIEDAKVAYLTADHLGSPRINTDRDGNVASRHDYHPFGEEITAVTTSIRIPDLGYDVDSVRKKFTGYERDDESGLDFADARMYVNQLGRFTGVDAGAFTPADPQNFNRYIYVQNNPMKFVDPTGKDLELKGDDAEYIKSQLEEYTGYKLIIKKGKVTIDSSVKRNEKGTSKNFADLISKITNKDYKANVVLNLSSKENDKIFVDKFSEKKLDVADYKAIKASANELAGALLSHVISEYDYAATEVGANPFKDVGISDAEYQFKLSHPFAKKFEAGVLSDLSGKDQGGERGEPRESNTSTKQTFVYKSIEYDIQRKSSMGNKGFNEVTSVTRRPK